MLFLDIFEDIHTYLQPVIDIAICNAEQTLFWKQTLIFLSVKLARVIVFVSKLFNTIRNNN